MNILTNEPLRSLTGAILGDNATSSNVTDDNWTLKYTTTISNVDNLSALSNSLWKTLLGIPEITFQPTQSLSTIPHHTSWNSSLITEPSSTTAPMTIFLLLDGFKIKFSETIHQSTVTTNEGSSETCRWFVRMVSGLGR